MNPRAQHLTHTLAEGLKLPPRPEQNAQALWDRKNLLRLQAEALAKGITPPASPARTIPQSTPNTNPALFQQDVKSLLEFFFGKQRKSVRANAIGAGIYPQVTKTPMVFNYYRTGGTLGKLTRRVSTAWEQLLCSVSSGFLQGKELRSTQGLNLIRIITACRAKCFLRTDEHGNPLEVRESTFVVLSNKAGEGFIQELGMGKATFYRALKHPLAHMFLRTHKVQVQTPSGDVRNIGTRITVSLYDPPMPEDIRQHFNTVNVEENTVLVSKSQNDTCKTPLALNYTDKTVEPVETWENFKSGVSNSVLSVDKDVDNYLKAQKRFEKLLDEEKIADKNFGGGGAGGDLRHQFPELWSMAGVLAVELGEANPKASQVVYCKALIILGEKECVRAFQASKKAWEKGNVKNWGSYYTTVLNRESVRRTGKTIKEHRCIA